MSTNQNPHPARSPEFLSRLHDQELSPGERAHFESHRAHCAECRTAAAQFEEALALFRASAPRPASPDLAARILRKLQASGGRRRPFGVTFGIDVRWAGALAAALVAAIVGTSIVMKNEAREAQSRLTRGPVPVVMESDHAKAPPASNAPAPGAPAPPARSSRASEPRGGAKDEAPGIAGRVAAPPEEKQKEVSKKLDHEYAQAPPPAAAANLAQAPAEDRQEAVDQGAAAPSRERAQEGKLEKPAPQAARAKSAAAARPDVQDRRQRLDGFAAQSTQRDQERPGGEGGAPAAPEEAAARPVRLVVTAADGAGPAPELIPSPTLELPADLRGREFVVIVDAAGRVRQVLPRRPALRDSARANENRLAKTQTASPLAALRFQPGDRQRRLLVRAE